jgi:hypothetical protein
MMRPAFSSTKQAAAFALLLLILLSLPAVVGESFLPPREQSYAALSWGSGPYPWIQQQLFGEKGDIDIALVGSSHILQCMDARLLQAELGEKLGRPATVRVIGWGGAGYDALYFITRDLLKNRKVRLLVFYNENNDPGMRNNQSPVWFRLADGAEALHGLPWSEQAYFYFAALVGMPRNMLALSRPNLPAELHAATPNYWEEHYRSANLADNLGSTTSELGFYARPTADRDCDPTIPFIPHVPQTTAGPMDACVYSAATQTNFQFSAEPLPVWQVHFARQFTAMVHEHGCRLVLLHIPTVEESHSLKIQERTFWRENLDNSLFLLGVPPVKMFGGLTDDEVRKLYFNPGHLNKNGQAYFTSFIGPALLQLYETQSGH